MKSRMLLVFVLVLGCIVQGQAQYQTRPKDVERIQRDVERIKKEIRHELLMLPYLGVFDNLAYKVDANDVTLVGQVTRPLLKSSAAKVIKKIEGVGRIDNQIEVLPLSPSDDILRLMLFRAIYGYGPLEKYSLVVNKPIRIIVNKGHVGLEGVVDNEGDKTIAGIRANGVSDVFSVSNNLQVVR